jgi:cell division protein FtsB
MDPSPSAPAEPASTRGPLARALSLRWHGVPVLTLSLLGFAACVIVGNWLPTRAATAATERAVEEQRRENRELAERIRRAEAEAVRLEKDPVLHERILRDQLRMSKPGEVLIR